MKILILASNNEESAKIISQGLHTKFAKNKDSADSPFIKIELASGADNVMMPPEHTREVVQAEFVNKAKHHPHFDKLAYLNNGKANVSAGTKDLIAVISVHRLAANQLKENLLAAGFDVKSCLAQYENKEFQSVGVIKDGQLLSDEAQFDFVTSNARIADLIQDIGNKATYSLNVGLTVHEQIDKAFSAKSPLSGAFTLAELTALRPLATKTEATLSSELIDEMLNAMQAYNAPTFDDLPENKKRYITEQAFIKRQIDSQEMTNLLHSDMSSIHQVAPRLSKLADLANRLNVHLTRAETATNLATLTMITQRIDTLLTDDRFTINGRNFNLMPDSIFMSITNKAQEVAHEMPLSASLINDSAASIDYNPKFPASSVLSQAVFDLARNNNGAILHSNKPVHNPDFKIS